MATVHLTIDGKPVTCEKDAMLLDVALANGFDIPHLCRHQAQEPYGACRLCLVEITQGNWNWVEASCTYPVREDGLQVRTDSEKVRRYKRLNLELLSARCPSATQIREMAGALGLGRLAGSVADRGRLGPEPDLLARSRCLARALRLDDHRGRQERQHRQHEAPRRRQGRIRLPLRGSGKSVR